MFVRLTLWYGSCNLLLTLAVSLSSSIENYAIELFVILNPVDASGAYAVIEAGPLISIAGRLLRALASGIPDVFPTTNPFGDYHLPFVPLCSILKRSG